MPRNDPAIENTYKFQTYLNYVSAISDYLGLEAEKIDEHYRDVTSSSKYRQLQSGRCDQDGLALVSRYLRNAWLTEIHIRVSNQTDEFISLSNHWTPVQLYYSVYLAIRAFFCSDGRNIANTHTKTLRVIASEIYGRSQMFPYPWRVLSDGDPEKRLFVRLPEGVKVEVISPLTANYNTDFWNRYCQFLKTTRERDCESRFGDWKKENNKKRIPKKVKQQLISGLGMTSFFDCLYRMRVRSNYIDADAFLFSETWLDEDILFHESLKNINWHVLLSLELLIAKCLGKKKYAPIVDRYRQSNITTELFEETVGKRWRFIQQHI